MNVPTKDESPDLWEAVPPGGNRRVLLSALEAFSGRGYKASTTREIARRAGMSPAAVYVHYRSKADLLYELSRIGHAAVLDDLRATLADGGASPERLHRFISTFVAWHARNHTLARVCQYELHQLPPERFVEIRKLREEVDRLLDAELERGSESGDFSITEVRSTKLALLSMGIDVARWWHPRSVPSQELADNYADLALRMVGATRP